MIKSDTHQGVPFHINRQTTICRFAVFFILSRLQLAKYRTGSGQKISFLSYFLFATSSALFNIISRLNLKTPEKAIFFSPPLPYSVCKSITHLALIWKCERPFETTFA